MPQAMNRLETHLGNLQQSPLLGVPASQWLVALAAALALYLALAFSLRLLRSRVASLAVHTQTRLDDTALEVLAGTSRVLVALAALLLGLSWLDLPERWETRVSQLWVLVLVAQGALWADRLVRIGLRHHELRQKSLNGAPVGAGASLVAWGLRVLLWTVVLMTVLANLGVNITALVASLGVGGVAVALAAQSILSDLFASVSIAVDKPFEVGDFVIVGEVSGVVEHVGIKSTRIRAVGGEQVVMSNTDLLKRTISNYKRLAQRRVVMNFGLAHDTPADAVQGVPDLVRSLVTSSPHLRLDRAHFKRIGEASLDFEIVYTVLKPDFLLHMDEQQRINLALLRSFKQNGIEFAFPMRSR
jgi:small-conductance mechanosensitive channel